MVYLRISDINMQPVTGLHPVLQPGQIRGSGAVPGQFQPARAFRRATEENEHAGGGDQDADEGVKKQVNALINIINY